MCSEQNRINVSVANLNFYLGVGYACWCCQCCGSCDYSSFNYNFFKIDLWSKRFKIIFQIQGVLGGKMIKQTL